MHRALIAIPLAMAGIAAAQDQPAPSPGEQPLEVPQPNPQPPQPAPDGVPPLEAPPIAPPPPGQTPPVAAPPIEQIPPAGTSGTGTVTYVNNTLPPAPAAQEVYPPCSATVQDQCQQREAPRRDKGKVRANRRN